MVDTGDSTPAAYATALAAGQPQDLTALLGPDVSFQSPFSLWQTPRSVAAAFHARCRAFDDLQVEHVLESPGRAVLLWQAQVGQRPVEGCEVLTLVDGRITAVSVFLRPAAVLEAVRVAMTAAWPEREASPEPP